MKKQTRTYLWIAVLVALLISACNPDVRAGDPTATPMPFFPATLEVTQEPLLPINPTPTANLTNPNHIRITDLEYLQEHTELLIIAKSCNTLV